MPGLGQKAALDVSKPSLTAKKTSGGSIERKYAFAAIHADILKRYLDSALPRDLKFPDGTISSIYFDTWKADFLAEKVNSDYLKSKFRLRTYEADEDNESLTCFWETKQKVGSVRHKHRQVIHLPRLDWESPYQSNFVSAILKQESPMFPNLQPAIRIQYSRQRWVLQSHGIRISLDSKIHSPDANPRIFRSQKARPLLGGVLEIKASDEAAADRVLPLMRPIRQWIRREAYSKYLRCCRAVASPMNLNF